MTMSWKKDLSHLSLRHFTYFANGVSGILEIGTKDFKLKYPGNYVIEEYYNSTAMKFDLRLIFENEQEELLWKIKWY